jgi:hypothetical protein
LVINDDPKELIIKSFSRRRTISGILLYATLACFALAINSFRHSDPTLTGLSPSLELGLGISVGIGLLVCLFFLWRCPGCNKFLGFKTNLKWCPHCKERLEPDWTKTEKPVMTMFKKKKKTMYILMAIMFIGLIPMYIASINPESKIAGVFGIIAIPFVFGALIYMFITWRCPNCKSYFWYESNPSNCPRCGIRLRM